MYCQYKYFYKKYIPEFSGDPIELSAFWYGLPPEVERVDAVYERADHRIVFFVGRHFYVLAGNSQLESGPTPIERLGLPPELERVDAAMRWGWNGKTYFFSGEFVCSEAPSFQAKLERGEKYFQGEM